jgi:hypothetical protein
VAAHRGGRRRRCSPEERRQAAARGGVRERRRDPGPRRARGGEIWALRGPGAVGRLAAPGADVAAREALISRSNGLECPRSRVSGFGLVLGADLGKTRGVAANLA